MNIISWNVNGIRAWKDKEGALAFINEKNPDVLCLQETKVDQETARQLSADSDKPTLLENHPRTFDIYPYEYWNSAVRKGYSGTALFSKTEPLSIVYGIGHELDSEGRVITAEFDDFFLVNVYTPNSKGDLSRLDLRYYDWDVVFLNHLKKLEQKKPVVVCGDLNVAYQEVDLARPEANKTTDKNPGSAGFTDKERERFGDLLAAGFVDTFRHLYPETVRYSWYSYRGMARDRNVGWRIDYFLISPVLVSKVKDSVIYDQVTGSDHCPIELMLE